jgi:hypothetical protein
MAAGCAKVFKEKISGAKTDRPELVKAIGRLEPGDVLVVTRLDRLARSTRDLLNVIAAITERGAGFKSLKDAWADTTSAHGPGISADPTRSARTRFADALGKRDRIWAAAKATRGAAYDVPLLSWQPCARSVSPCFD